MKKIYILLFITFISNLTPMQIQDEKELTILDLPNEVLDNIVKQVMKEDFLEALNNWNDIFESPKINLSLIADLAKTCSRFRDVCQYIFELKKIKFELLFKNLKNESLEEYKDISKEELNNRLANLLNNIFHSSIFHSSNDCKEKLKNAVKLIFAGADINTKSNYGKTALMLAARKGYREIVEMLINLGADVNIQNNNGFTALMWAAQKGYKEIVEILLDAGADVNAKDNQGHTALMCAAIRGRKEIVEILLDAGVDVNAKDNQGNTALMCAAAKGHKNIVEILIKAGADVNIQNNDGFTALMWAAYYGHKEIVEILLDAGADVNIQNNNGKTVLILAVEKGHKEIAEILKTKVSRGSLCLVQ